MTKEQALDILAAVPYSTVATTDEAGKPWAAPQFMLYDAERKAMYWCAARDSQHARNIATNPDVYIVTYNSMAAPGEGEGVYFRARAAIVENAQELAETHAKIVAKHQNLPYWGLEGLLRPDAAVAMFRANVTEAWVNTDRTDAGHYTIVRAPIEL